MDISIALVTSVKKANRKFWGMSDFELMFQTLMCAIVF